MRTGLALLLLWTSPEGLECVAVGRRERDKRWELRVVHRSRIVKRELFTCLTAAMRAAHAWRSEFGAAEGWAA